MPHPSLKTPKGLLDLVACLPELGGGEVFIQVQRIKPLTAFNVPCAGVQKPLWRPCDDAEFQGIYGGAEYLLKGYRYDANGKTSCAQQCTPVGPSPPTATATRCATRG